MDPLALNYRSFAERDDSSCIIGGCTDRDSVSFDVRATYNDGSCVRPGFKGCTDPAASNYRAVATREDGSCRYAGCIDSIALNYNPTASVSGWCSMPIPGCINPVAVNYYRAGQRSKSAAAPVPLFEGKILTP